MAYTAKSRFTIVLADNNAQTAQASLRVPDTISTAEVLAIRDAILGICNGVAREYGHVVTQEDEGLVFSTDVDADTRHAWRVLYRDNVLLKQYTVTLRVANPASRRPQTDELDLSAGVGLAFKTAFEAHVLSPDDNAVTILRVDYI